MIEKIKSIRGLLTNLKVFSVLLRTLEYFFDELEKEFPTQK